MNRLTFEEYGCFLALVGKSRSVDPHTRIGGCALDKSGRVLGVSYNGLKSGVEMPDWMKLEENRARKSDLFIHCESNLCSFLKKDECHTMCLTQSPCIRCCQNIAALNVSKVIYLKEYRKCSKFKDFFNFHGIDHKEAGSNQKENIKQYILDMNNFTELNDH